MTERISEGTLFIPMHFAAGAVNKLTQETFDPHAGIPKYKVSSVFVEALGSDTSADVLRTPTPEPAAELRTGTAETGVGCPAVGSWPPPLNGSPVMKSEGKDATCLPRRRRFRPHRPGFAEPTSVLATRPVTAHVTLERRASVGDYAVGLAD